MVKSIIGAIDQIAQENGQFVAYDELGVVHTYHDLKIASDRIATYLLQQDLPADAPIMIYGGQQFEMIASFLGSVKAGHAYIPVDVNSADERLLDILEIGQPAAVIAVDDLPIKIAAIPVITNEALANVMNTAVALPTLPTVDHNQDFYIIFTSGTTGKPKGVQINHQNLLSFVNWMLSDEFGFKQQQCVLSQPPYSFDLSVMDWAPTLVSGGILKALPKTIADDFKQLFATLPQLNLNIWVSTPSFADVALLDPEFNEINNPHLQRFLFCGEALTSTTAQKLHERFPKAKIFNTYGPTEATVAVTGIEITEDILANHTKLPIGFVKADTTITIQDVDSHATQPTGQAGEIVISGPSVSKGYLNNPEKTAVAFTTIEGQPAYRTGDLGMLDEQGVLHYQGRSDFQIKLHGYRIELEEVAQVLQHSQWIEQAVSVPRYDQDGKVKQLLAIVVAKKNDFDKPILLTNAIKAELKDIMMPYMMPSRFIYRESLPMTANGKTDLKTLIAEVNGNA